MESKEVGVYKASGLFHLLSLSQTVWLASSSTARIEVLDRKAIMLMRCMAVSYTHLTLPTKLEV